MYLLKPFWLVLVLIIAQKLACDYVYLFNKYTLVADYFKVSSLSTSIYDHDSLLTDVYRSILKSIVYEKTDPTFYEVDTAEVV